MNCKHIMQPMFVIGTDTDIGKTVFSLLLMKYLQKIGCNPFYLKPFQTGCESASDSASDAKFIYDNIDSLKGQDPAQSMIFCHKSAKAPYFAARDQSELIDLNKAYSIIEQKIEDNCHVILEAAGGLLVPITGKTLIIDVIRKLKAEPIIVARAGLGTINHTLLTIEVMKSSRIKPLAVVLMDSDNSTSDEMIAENIEAIEVFSGCAVAGVIKKIDNFNNIDESNFKVFEKIFHI